MIQNPRTRPLFFCFLNKLFVKRHPALLNHLFSKNPFSFLPPIPSPPHCYQPTTSRPHPPTATTRRPPLPPSRRAWGCGLRSPGLEIWKCSACDYRRTAQGTMSDGCRAVRKQPLPHHARRSESRRTLSPVLSECGVSTHSISPGTAAEATAPRAA